MDKINVPMNKDIKKYPPVLGYLLSCAALLLLWHEAALFSALPFIPAPLDVAKNTVEIFFTKLVYHLSYSMYRILTSLFISLLLGVALGMMVGYFPSLDRLLSPVVYILYPVPKIALLPVVMLMFGLGEASKLVMITLILFFQILVSCRDSIKSIPPETYHCLSSLGAKPMQVFKEIIFPASLPNLLTAVRVSLGTALSVLFFTETFGTEYGLGFFIMDAWMRVNYTEMYSGIIVLSLTGLGLFLILDILEKQVCKWKE